MDSTVRPPDWVARAFGTRNAPRLVTQTAGHSTLALTEIRGGVKRGFTAPIPYDEAYLLQLRLSSLPVCNYFSEGRHVAR